MTTVAKGAGAAVDWLGELEHTPLAEVIRRIVFEERSGDLRVTSSNTVKTLHFDRGFIVFASSNLKSDSLGDRLISSGRISPHEFALVKMLTKGSKRSFRQTLSHAGIVPEEELGRHVAAQVNQIVLSLFSWKEGTYNFEEGPCSIPLELMVSLSAHRIMLEGIRRMSSGKLILAGLPPLDTMIRVVQAPLFSLDFEKLRPDGKLRAPDRGFLDESRFVKSSREQEPWAQGQGTPCLLRIAMRSGVLEVGPTLLRTPQDSTAGSGEDGPFRWFRNASQDRAAGGRGRRLTAGDPSSGSQGSGSRASPTIQKSLRFLRKSQKNLPNRLSSPSCEFGAEQAAKRGGRPALGRRTEGRDLRLSRSAALVATAKALWAAVATACRGAKSSPGTS